MKEVVDLQNTNFRVSSSRSPDLFFGHLLLQGICGTFLGILGCLRQAGRIEERKCRAIRTKIPFPAIQMLLQNLPEREKH